jgi:hypothetical protein
MADQTQDYILKLSQSQSNPLDLLVNPFPEIPDPPPGWDPEVSPIRTDSVSPPPPDYINKAVAEGTDQYIPYAKVFLVTEDGNPEYEEVLRRGARGDILIAKKEVADMRNTVAFKVYMEWLEIVAKK